METTLSKKETGIKSYDVKVDKKGLPTRKSVEAQLTSASESISNRLENIQAEVTSTGDALRNAFRKRPFLALATALGIGITIGYFSGDDDEIEVDAFNALATGVTRAIESGADPNEALRTVLKNMAPLHQQSPAPKAAKASSSVASSLINVGMTMALQRLSALFSEESGQK